MYRRTAHFNSRPHGGRQRQPQPLCRLYISTHALTEGDTAIFHPFSDTEISTHALTEGDEDLDTILPPCIAISTHALTEGDIRATCFATG